MVKSDEELARMLQAEEDAMMFQQFVAAEDSGGFEERVRPYVSQVLMYEDPVHQEAARKTVPKDELEEKALVSLAKTGKEEVAATDYVEEETVEEPNNGRCYLLPPNVRRHGSRWMHTPGMAISKTYKENSPDSLIPIGLLNPSSAGLLIKMALVDLLAVDFMGQKMQRSIKLQLKSYVAVLFGAGGMSLMELNYK